MAIFFMVFSISVRLVKSEVASKASYSYTGSTDADIGGR